ncbi:MAG: hypothetical protein LBN18_02860 [Dysgonamonadaceae bacterium]|jgi:hypothetical protein|nr:hypothetical protein [Dysgonamonadaceae bacterium]
MKKALSLLLLIVTLLASPHATLAFHYCGKTFRSIEIAGSETVSCCERTKRQAAHDNGNSIQDKTCCSNHYLEIGTDDFTTTQNVTIENHKNFHSIIYLFAPVLEWNNPPMNIFQRIFIPPGGWAKSGINRQAFICIFRI